MATYAGRKTDLLIMQLQGNPETYVSTPVNLDFGTVSRITAGIQKITQQFLMAMLTRRGSARFDPEYGTDFMTSIRRGEISDGVSAAALFNEAAKQAESYLRSREGARDLPTDERIASVKLLQWDVTGDRLYLRVGITTEADLAREYLVPLSVPIL